MATVAVTINGRQYPVNCDDGNEDHVCRLADYVDGKVSELAESVGRVGDTQLLVMASLLVADELSDALYGAALPGRGGAKAVVPDGLAQRLDTAAVQIEGIAGELERS
jgi:cell division protein ZapA